MKRGLLILLVAAGLGFIVLSSYEHGPAYDGGLNRTGSTGGAATCAGSTCHDANTPTTIVQLIVTNTAGAPVTSYAPGTTYMVTITGYNTTATATDKFGFQVSAVNSSSIQAGNFGVASGSDLRITSLSGLQIVEHKEPLEDTTANHFIAHFSWTAPAAGTGTVTFYGILNAIGEGSSGGGGDDDEGDDEGSTSPGGSFPNTAPNLVLTESGGGANAVATISTAVINVYPNPFKNTLHIDRDNTLRSACNVFLFDTKGAMVYSSVISTAQESAALDVSAVPAGAYQVVITDGHDKRTFPVSKVQ